MDLEWKLSHRPNHLLGTRLSVRWRRHLLLVIWILAIIGGGLAEGVALAQYAFDSPLEAIAAEKPTTTPNPKSDTARLSCVAEAFCSVVAAPANGHLGLLTAKTVGDHRDIEFRSGLAIPPISPPPKSIVRT